MRGEFLEDASGFRGHAEQVFTPGSEEEVAEILGRASRDAVPVTVAGAGTGLTGGGVAQGGWAVSLAKLKRLEVFQGRAVAGAGVLLADLHAAAAASGQFFPPDPTETGASVGGAVATNASGSRGFRYGDTRRHLLGLRVVLADGRVMEARRGDRIDFDVPRLPVPTTTKHAAGFRLAPGMDWIDLFAGSEGVLGIVTQAELRLLPAPAELFSAVVFFPNESAVLDAVEAWRGVGGLRMLEYLDGASLRLVEAPAAGGALLIEQELDASSADEIDRWVDRLAAVGALEEESWFAAGERDRERFRRFRHALPEAVNDIVRRNGLLKAGSDCAVPLERSRDMLAFYRQRLDAEFPGQAVIFGHIGDAHLHVNVLPRDQAELERANALMLEFARRAVELGGTVSAEHGLGKRKAKLLAIQYAPGEIEAMKQVKRRLDPQWLLGRGTLLPG